MKNYKGWRMEMIKGQKVYVCDETEMVAIPHWTINGTLYRVFHKGVELTA